MELPKPKNQGCTCRACQQNEVSLERNNTGLDKLAKSPVAIRAVTLFLLLISELDVIFGQLFVYELYQLAVEAGFIFGFFFAVLVIGILTYVVGVLYFAPLQLLRTPYLVKVHMEKVPADFTTHAFYQLGGSRDGEVVSKGLYEQLRAEDEELLPKQRSYTLTMDSTVFPKTTRRQTDTQTFAELDLKDIDDANTFRKGLEAWGLLHVWAEIEGANVWNSAQPMHGVPFYRLAKFGFMSQPDARDLGGILNCNALYTVCTGLVQICFGVVVVAYNGGMTVNSAIPLLVSTCSLILSCCNIAFDFSGKLIEAENENRTADRLEKDFEAFKADVRRKARVRNKESLDGNNEWFQSELMFAETDRKRQEVMVQKKRMDELATTVLKDELETIERTVQEIVEADLVAYRRGKARTKGLRQGMKLFKCEKKENALQRVQDQENRFASMEAELEKQKLDKLSKVINGSSQMSGPEFESEMQVITLEFQLKMKSLKAAWESSLDDAQLNIEEICIDLNAATP